MNWLTRLFARDSKPPEPSCFVKGLIRSMKETPEKWERHHISHCDITSWGHSCPYVLLWLPDLWHRSVHSVSSDFPKLTRAEKKALTHALFEYLEKPYHAKIVEALTAPFEKLGCPDQS